ncbi:MAG: hypothetical protein ACYCYP_06720 [Leptospirales bacterium]
MKSSTYQSSCSRVSIVPILLGFVLVLSGCARIIQEKSQNRIWQSAPREPVWVHHALPPSQGSVFLVGSGRSESGRRSAREKAIGMLADSLVRTLESSGMRFTMRERAKLLGRFVEDLDRGKKGPLFIKDEWKYEYLPNSDDPFHVESRAWILADVSVRFLDGVRHELMSQDRERFRQIRMRHRKIVKLLGQFDGTEALLLLARNLRTFSRIHFENSFPKSSLGEFVLLYRNEASLWGQFLETVEIRPVARDFLPIQVSLYPFRPFRFPLKIKFRIAGVWHGLSGFRPMLFLEPLPEKLPFPPVPIYKRSNDVSRTPFTASMFWWAGDLGRYVKSQKYNILVSDCSVSSAGGISTCRITRVPDVSTKGFFKIVLVPGSSGGSDPDLDRVVGRISGRIPLKFLHRRANHPLDLRVEIQVPGALKGKVGDVFRRTLEKNLLLKEFIMSRTSAGADSPKRLDQKVLRSALHPRPVSVLTIRLFRERIRSVSIPSAMIVVLWIPYQVDVRDALGHILWQRKGEAKGTGIGIAEARVDALDGLEKDIPDKLDKLLWPLSIGKNWDFFWSTRTSLLNGLAFCQDESS